MKRRGKVKGRTIVFDEPLDLQEGQAVEVEIHSLNGAADSDPAESKGVSGSADSDIRDIDASANRADIAFAAIPAGGNPVTNEMVNELREELGI